MTPEEFQARVNDAATDQVARDVYERRRMSELFLANADGLRDEVKRWIAETEPTKEGKPDSEHLLDAARRVANRYLGLNAKPEVVTTGFADLDQIVSLEPQSLVVVGARSGRGKSSLAMQFAIHVGEHFGASLFFSSEMSSEQLALRAMCSMASVDSKRIRRGLINDSEGAAMIEAVDRVTKCMSWVSDETGMDVLRVKEKSRREVKRIERERGSRVRLIVVDYLQRIRAGKAAPHGANREQQVAAIAFELKELARELNVCVVVPAQLNADADTRKDNARPRASDLRESKGIENEADAVLLIHNPHYIARCESSGQDLSIGEACEIILAKGRSDGNGKVDVWFTPLFARFASMSDHEKYALQKQASK